MSRSRNPPPNQPSPLVLRPRCYELTQTGVRTMPGLKTTEAAGRATTRSSMMVRRQEIEALAPGSFG
jgi:hypothetical protein